MHMNPSSSRRRFLLQSAMAGTGLLLSRDLLALGGTKRSGVTIGTITYSFRSLPGDAASVLKYCKESGISAIELMGDTAEDFAGSPAGLMPPMGPGFKFDDAFRKQMQERNAKAKAWRETTGMDKFVELRKMYNDAGVSIYAYKPNALNPDSSDGEIEYALKAAKALGANSVTVELPKDAAHSKRLGAFASKHKVYIGYHAHTQATDTAWDEALAQSPYNSMNLDCGHYIAAGGANTKETLLALIEKKHDRITSMHIKDRTNKDHGAGNLPWGTGDTPIKEILQLMQNKGYTFPATIELEYEVPAGSTPVAEVGKCLAYAKAALG
jgi:sugar phosphate isomerase/epimerase